MTSELRRHRHRRRRRFTRAERARARAQAQASIDAEIVDAQACYMRNILPYPHRCTICGEHTIELPARVCTNCGYDEKPFLNRCPYSERL